MRDHDRDDRRQPARAHVWRVQLSQMGVMYLSSLHAISSSTRDWCSNNA
jgi:hypothetical protein